ncbi:MAG: hypothetical protein LM593_02745 [Candidatus Verstraetearchaeota archaeon]|jgi:hypothetical protein|nr:hypothetical protein [Candidatus Verstraetearchaeota archaeon]
MENDIISAIEKQLNEGKGFEINFKGEIPNISDIKGISKISKEEIIDNIKGIKKIKKKKILEEHKNFIIDISKVLIKNKIPFKVTIFPNEVILRFDLDHYIHLYPDKFVIIGFNSLNEFPISLIKSYFPKDKEVKILHQVR